MDGYSDPLRLVAGELILLPPGAGFRLCSALSVQPADAIEFLTTVPPGALAILNGGGDCSGVGGYFELDGFQAQRLLGLLPAVIHITGKPNTGELRALIERSLRELREPLPGGSLLIEHLIQTLLIEALRIHMAERPAERAGWLFALADRQLGVALTAMHARPGYKWTLSSLAKTAAMSRSRFAVRFRGCVGEPPMEYLTRWRMSIAAQRLAHEGATIAAVASSLSYESESAFGAAFKRVVGVSPRRFVNSAAARISACRPRGGESRVPPAAASRSAGPR